MIRAILIALTITTTGVVLSQTPPNLQQPPQGNPGDASPGRPPGGPGAGPGSQPELKLVKEFDRNSDGRLDATERKAARAAAVERRAEQRSRGPGGGGPRGPGGRRASAEPPTPGPAVARDQAALHSDLPLYHSNVVRTLFLDFEESDWEKQLEDFHNTDVEVPARMTLDGKEYQGVGIHFRGASSYFMNGPGSKRSLNVSVDLTDKKQNVQGHRTLNLLNCHGDPSFLRAGLYSDIARRLIPAPAHNFVRVVINGESWGLYVGMEQFNKDFVQSWFGTSEGARWKVTGSPRGKGGLEYLGDDPEPYRSIYTIKSKDRPEDWAALIRLCKVLNETPAESLEKALDPLLNVEGVLRFLALENVLVNTDGYWSRASDYNLYRHPSGRFHIIPHDINESFMRPEGPGFRGGGRGQDRDARPPGEAPPVAAPNGPAQLSPLVAEKDERKPLLSKLLAVPALRTRYLTHVKQIASQSLDWSQLGTAAERYHSLIAPHVGSDTRKLATTKQFESSLVGPSGSEAEPGRGAPMALKAFADQRRAFLLSLPELQALP